jgi:hypothetical protein
MLFLLLVSLDMDISMTPKQMSDKLMFVFVVEQVPSNMVDIELNNQLFEINQHE